MRKLAIAMAMSLAPAVGMACSPPVDRSPPKQRVLRAYCSAEVLLIGGVSEQRQLGGAVEHEIRPIAGLEGADVGRNTYPMFALTRRDVATGEDRQP